MNLTPYDTGERLEPKPWPTLIVRIYKHTDAEMRVVTEDD